MLLADKASGDEARRSPRLPVVDDFLREAMHWGSAQRANFSPPKDYDAAADAILSAVMFGGSPTT